MDTGKRLRYLVLGASGMAGHVVTTHLRDSGHEVMGLSGHTRVDNSTVLIDVFDRSAFLNFMRSQTVDIVVNCIGALVADSTSRPDRAAYLNSYLPHLLEAEYADAPTRVIQLSTDCVFSGRDGHYTENAVTDGTSFYDRSKALGELHNKKDLTLRTSIIGPEIRPTASGLLHWFLTSKGTVKGYKASLWNGLTTLELAKQIERLSFMPEVTGIVHPVPKQVVAKYDLLVLMAEVFRVDSVNIEAVEGKSANKSLLSTRVDYAPPEIDHLGMLRELRRWMMAHSEMYQEYEWFSELFG